MLGRIWDTYVDVSYQPEEILYLRDECLRAKASALVTGEACTRVYREKKAAEPQPKPFLKYAEGVR
jgi:hypothetical protein